MQKTEQEHKEEVLKFFENNKGSGFSLLELRDSLDMDKKVLKACLRELLSDKQITLHKEKEAYLYYLNPSRPQLKVPHKEKTITFHNGKIAINKGELKFGLLISFSVILIMLLFFEVYLRLTYEVHEPKGCTVYSDKLLWIEKPNCGPFNNHGYRDYNHSFEKKEGTFRIIIIGDSVVAGHNVELDEGFGIVLQQKLNENAEDVSFETILLGVSGYTTTQELILLKEEALRYDPDLIIWDYILNDPLNPVYHPTNYNDPRYGFQSKWYNPPIHVLAFVKKKLFFIEEKFKSSECPGEYHRFLHCAYRDEIDRNLGEIGKFSQQNNIPIIFVINPVYHYGAYKQYMLSTLHMEVRDLAENKGLIVYDILDAFKTYDVAEVGMCSGRSCDVWHPSPQGHEVIADYLYNKLKEDNYVAQ